MGLENKTKKSLDRMQYLMEYASSKPLKTSGIEYHTVAADGNAYGIIKEGDTYYIKKTTADKELIKESYDYLKGFNYRNEFGYKSYDKATKHLELEIMAINESYNKHEDVSVVDFKKGEKDMTTLTEEARKELDRVNQIFDNSMKIGRTNTGDPESKGKAEEPTEVGKPFEEKVKATLDKDLEIEVSVEDTTPDNKKVEKGERVETLTDEDFEDAHSDIDGKNVAEQKPKGATAVKVNEALEEEKPFDETDFKGDEVVKDLAGPDLEGEIHDEEEMGVDELEDESNGNELVGFDAEDELDRMLQEVEGVCVSAPEETNNAVAQVNECGDEVATDFDAINEKIDKLANLVMEKLTVKREKKSKLEETIEKMVCEELHNLNAWGKHPKYQKQTFASVEDKDVLVNDGDKEWDDKSAKSCEPYGKKIGDGKPFDKIVDLMTDAIVKSLKEDLGLKKK